MWPFSKQKPKVLGLPPLPGSKKEEEITLLPEEGFIPEELPQLEPKPGEKVEGEKYEGPVFPTVPEEEPEKVVKAEIVQKFVRTDRYKNVISEINNMNADFDTINFEVAKIVELKNERNGKIDSLQNTLEETSKKLMYVENILFGG